MATKSKDGGKSDEIKATGSSGKKSGDGGPQKKGKKDKPGKDRADTGAANPSIMEPRVKAPPSKHEDDEVELGQSLKNFRQFVKEVFVEFGKISWPGRQQVIKETWSVLFLVTVITLMVLGFDWFLGHAIFGPLEHWARLHGGGIGNG